MNGKGSKPRPFSVSRDQYEANWDKAFPPNKVPIHGRCPNSGSGCFCTGACREVIGYREKHPLEK